MTPRLPRDERPIVPDLIGLSLKEACEAAAWASVVLSPTFVQHARAAQGTVVAQSPPPGSRLAPLWRVHVLVAAGKVAGPVGR